MVMLPNISLLINVVLLPRKKAAPKRGESHFYRGNQFRVEIRKPLKNNRKRVYIRETIY